MLIKVCAHPGSKCEGVTKIAEDKFKVNVRALPENGAANARIIELLALYFAVLPGNVRLLNGGRRAHKIFEIKV